MSCPLNLQALPAHVLHQVLSPEDAGRRSVGRSLTTYSFPRCRTSLWDGRPTGEKRRLQLCYHRKPRLLLSEKALRLARRHVRRSDASQVDCFFLGTVDVDADEEGGVTVTLERFDPGRAGVPAAPVPGDFPVPCLFSGHEDAGRWEAELQRSVSELRADLSGRPLDLRELLRVKGRVSCQQQGDADSFRLDWSCVCPSVRLDVHPVRPVPVVPTALLKSLTDAGRPVRRRGFLTMQENRKLLLLLETDPNAAARPLVGIWLTGVNRASNPNVLAWCLRFLFGSALQDRVLSEDGAFLLVLFVSPRAAPEFFQCRRPASGPPDCRLLSASRYVTLYQAAPAEGRTLEFELSPEEGDDRRVRVIRDAPSSFGSSGNAETVSERDSGVEDQDWSPRPSPRPHLPAHWVPRVRPAVPELSLLTDGGEMRAPPLEIAAPATPLFHSTPDPRPPRDGPELPSGPPRPARLSCDGHECILLSDQKLRLLQAQVQKLLEAQEIPPFRNAAPPTASVAVETGASLLWASQTPTKPPSPASRAPPTPPSADGGRTPLRAERDVYRQLMTQLNRRLRGADGDRREADGGGARQMRARDGGHDVVEVSGDFACGGGARPDGSAISLGYAKPREPGLRPDPAPISPSDMTAATADYMRRHCFFPASSENADGPAKGRVLDIDRLKRLPKLL
ncbi:SCL-interrupting locus protein homolog isoform X2 [Corythoichthys intestinalis]|uniref:SCL-interrupting locus protein homolog isoform X2 n=1 Tax=Corythoichthys intestinalis TaxID=161448 RepID=UPI0025A4E09D|nr:SCL-interrupting locus protein homolog isoform X2 [Corythoichthys intestinalis]